MNTFSRTTNANVAFFDDLAESSLQVGYVCGGRRDPGVSEYRCERDRVKPANAFHLSIADANEIDGSLSCALCLRNEARARWNSDETGWLMFRFITCDAHRAEAMIGRDCRPTEPAGESLWAA